MALWVAALPAPRQDSGCSISTVTFQALVSSSCSYFFFKKNCAKSPLSGNLPQQACLTHPFRNVFFSPEYILLSGHPSYSQLIYVKVMLPSKSRGFTLKYIQFSCQKTKRPSPCKHHPHFEVFRCTYCVLTGKCVFLSLNSLIWQTLCRQALNVLCCWHKLLVTSEPSQPSCSLTAVRPKLISLMSCRGERAGSQNNSVNMGRKRSPIFPFQHKAFISRW